MNFRDRRVTDAEGSDFIFTVEMQRQLVKAGLPAEPEYLDQLPSQSSRSNNNDGGSRPPREQRAPREPREQREPRESSKRDEIEGPASVQIDPMTGKYIGRVKWYNARKGYGFILRGAGEEIFFHRSNATGNPEQFEEGQWILYDVEETDKGPEATEVEDYDGEV